MKRLIGAAVGLFMMSACAAGTTDLTLGLVDTDLKEGVIAEADSKAINLTVTDGRDQTDRIGDKRNGYGAVMGSIGTTEPVTDIVGDTITKTFTSNGHTVVDENGGGLNVEAEVKRFWFDYKTGLVTVEFFGDVQVAMTVKEPGSDEVLFEETFKGYYSDKTGGGLSKTWTRVMNAALNEFSRELSLSDELLEALEEADGATLAKEPEAVAAVEAEVVEEVTEVLETAAEVDVTEEVEAVVETVVEEVEAEAGS